MSRSVSDRIGNLVSSCDRQPTSTRTLLILTFLSFLSSSFASVSSWTPHKTTCQLVEVGSASINQVCTSSASELGFSIVNWIFARFTRGRSSSGWTILGTTSR